MSPDEQVMDSPKGWVARHIQEYVESDGERGHAWKGVPTLLLTTRGRKTAKLRRTALIYGRSGEDYVVVASVGGGPDNPQWYLNLVDEPQVHIQVGGDQMDAVTRTAQGDERERLWRQMAEIWPDYEKYRQKTDREIPVVVISPTEP